MLAKTHIALKMVCGLPTRPRRLATYAAQARVSSHLRYGDINNFSKIPED
jgi:hypothetical protein